MSERRIVFAILAATALLIAAVSAGQMISVASGLNAAAAYAASHPPEAPTPLDGVTLIEPPTTANPVARYGAAVEVQITRRYQTLRHLEVKFAATYFYGPTGAGWEQLPYPPSFWGEPQVTAGEHVTIAHPQRVAKLAKNLQPVADAALAAACAHWQCPANALPITFTFSTDPAAPPTLLTQPAPQYTGVPMTQEANDDYLSYLSADTVMALAEQLGGRSPFARAFGWREIAAQSLYAALPDTAALRRDTAPPLAEVWAVSADPARRSSGVPDEAALSFVNFILTQQPGREPAALQALLLSQSFEDWCARVGLGDAQALDSAWRATLP